MKISVVIPVYNAEKYLHFSLGSVLGQTHTDWECICVDDGSTDGSGNILDEYAAKDPRFRVIHQPNAGEGAARNAGMTAAVGELIAFIDSGDTFHPHAFAIMARTCAKTGADMIRYGWNIVESHDKKFGDVPAEPMLREVNFKNLAESPMRSAKCGAFTTISRTLSTNVKWPDITHCEDQLFLLKCFQISQKTILIDTTLAHYLYREKSAVHNATLQIITATCLYLPQAYDACAALPGFANSCKDTCRFIAGFLDGPLKGCWRKLPRSDRKEAKRAVLRARWEMAMRDPSFPRPKKRLHYDLAFSIGATCTCSEHLRLAGLQYLSFPGDWTGGPSFDERIADVINGFSRLLASPDDLTIDGDKADNGIHLNLVDRKTNYHYYHDFPIGRSIAESFSDIKTKYIRRTKRFFELLEKSSQVLLVWMGESRISHPVYEQEIITAKKILSKQWPDKTFHFLVLVYKNGILPADMIRSSGTDFDRFEFDYGSHTPGAPRWKFDAALVQPILRRFAVTDYRTRKEKSTYRRMKRAKDFARFGVSSYLGLLIRRTQYKILRHFRHKTDRKGGQFV